MKSIDTRSSLRIAVLMEMLEDVSRAQDAEEAFRAYAKRIRRVRPVDAFVRVSTVGLESGRYRVVRSVRAEGESWGVALAGPEDWGALPPQTNGFVGVILGRREPQLYQEMAHGPDPVLGDLLVGMGSCMCVPMFEGGKIGGWSLLFRADPQGYAIADLEDDLLIGNLLGAMTLNMSAVEQISELNAQLQAQVEEVARVQRSLLPDHSPVMGGVRFAASYQASGQAGGDYYDFFELGAGRVGILIADVSGHGAAAATVMAMVHAMLHARPDLCSSPAGALKFVNARLVDSSIEGGHVTAVFAVLEAGGRKLTFARAGHPLPRLRRADGSVVALGGEAGEGAAPMGIVAEGYEPRETTVELAPGETVVLYTDGISEAENAKGEQIGVEGLDRAIGTSSGGPEHVIEAIRGAVAVHGGSGGSGGAGNGPPVQRDDQALVVFRIEQ